MSITVASIFLDVLENVCDAGNYSASTNTYILNLLNQTHAELMTDCKLITQGSTVISLASGTAEYALTPAIVRIWNAAYILNASDAGSDLTPTTTNQLDETQPQWRTTNDPLLVPTFYYQDGTNIGFFNPPNASTVAGYPNITVYGDSFTALGAGDSLPAQIQPSSIKAWTYGVCKSHVAARSPELLDTFSALYEAEKAKLIRLMGSRLANLTRRPYQSLDVGMVNTGPEAK